MNCLTLNRLIADSGVINGGDIGFDREEIPAQQLDDEDIVTEFDPSMMLDVTNI